MQKRHRRYNSTSCYELTYFLNTWLGRNVTTRRGVIPISSPVRGFRPFLAPLLRTTKFPNPAILTESPFCNTPFRRFRTSSTMSAASFFEMPTCLNISFAISAFLIAPLQPTPLESAPSKFRHCAMRQVRLNLRKVMRTVKRNLESPPPDQLFLGKKLILNTVCQCLPACLDNIFRYTDRAPLVFLIA